MRIIRKRIGAWEMSPWTFEIRFVKKILQPELKLRSDVLIPFAGQTRFTKKNVIYVDIMDGLPKPYFQMNVLDFLKDYVKSFDLIIADPPYSSNQAVRTYNNEKHQEITMYKNAFDKVLRPGGIIYFFGYNSTGMGRKRGYEMTDIYLLNLAGSHNDIIITREVKTQQSLEDFNCHACNDSKIGSMKTDVYGEPKEENPCEECQ